MTSQPVDVSRISMVISMFILTSLVAQSLGLLIGKKYHAITYKKGTRISLKTTISNRSRIIYLPTTDSSIGCASDAQTAVFLGPLSVIPTCLFSGFFISLQDMPGHMDKISYLTYVRFGKG